MSTVMNQRVKVEKTLTINKPVEELYRFWRNFDNLPRFIKHLKEVKVYDEKRSHWISKGFLNESFDLLAPAPPHSSLVWRLAFVQLVLSPESQFFIPIFEGGY